MDNRDFCKLCHRFFTGKLQLFWIGRRGWPTSWYLDEKDDLAHTQLSWHDFKDQLRIDGGTNPRRSQPRFGVLRFHSHEEMDRCAEQGCPSCELFAEEYRASNRSQYDGDTADCRGVMVLSQYGDRLKLELWFIDDKLWGRNSHPSVQDPSKLKIDLVGPMKDPSIKMVGNMREPTLEIMRDWYRSCSKHEECIRWREQLRQVFSQKTPTRLLRITAHANGDVVQLVTSQQQDPMPEYATLSYCWGRREIKQKLTTTNYDKYVSGMLVEDLPKTFRDAVEVTRAFGLDHLWIDALCIIQDSVDDWNQEAPRMGPIYSQSSLNLAAGAAQNCDGGLFVEPSPTLSKRFHVEWKASHINGHKPPNGWFRLQPDPTSWSEGIVPLTKPLQRRSWAMQERVLSCQVIIFDLDNLYWRCPTSASDERYQISHWDHTDTSLEDALWIYLVQGYMNRHLTFLTDRLVAFSAIAEAFGALRGMKSNDYLAGMWRQGLKKQLLWYLKSPASTSTEEASCLDKQIPSWSWACLPNLTPRSLELQSEYWSPIDSEYSHKQWLLDEKFHGDVEVARARKVKAPYWHEGLEERDSLFDREMLQLDPWHPSFQVLSASTQPMDGNPFSRIVDSELRVQGALHSISVRSDTERKDHQLCQVDGNDEIQARYCPDRVRDSNLDEIPQARFLPIVRYPRGWSFLGAGLVLMPIDNLKATYKRIGLLILFGEIRGQVPSWWASTSTLSDEGELEGRETKTEIFNII